MMEEVRSLLRQGDARGRLQDLWLAVAEREYSARFQEEKVTEKVNEMDAATEQESARLVKLRQEMDKLSGKEIQLESLLRNLDVRKTVIKSSFQNQVMAERQKQEEILGATAKAIEGIQMRISQHTTRTEAVEIEKEELDAEVGRVLAEIKTFEEEDKIDSLVTSEELSQHDTDLDAEGNMVIPKADADRFTTAQEDFRTRLEALKLEEACVHDELREAKKVYCELGDKMTAIGSSVTDTSALIKELDSKSTQLDVENTEKARRIKMLDSELSARLDVGIPKLQRQLSDAKSLSAKLDLLTEGLSKSISDVEEQKKERRP